MHTARLASLVAAWGTWATFTYMMKVYFRYSGERTLAKTVLILFASACTGAQLATLSLTRPADPVWIWSGVVGFAFAQGLFWWAVAAHGKAHPAFAFINVDPASLTTAGPYRLIRHPIYTAYLLAWCAGVVMTANMWLVPTALCMIPFYYLAARQEETAYRASTLASQYQEYQARTGMFLPSLTASKEARKAA